MFSLRSCSKLWLIYDVVKDVKVSRKERVYINKGDVGRSVHYVTYADHMMGSKPVMEKGGG